MSPMSLPTGEAKIYCIFSVRYSKEEKAFDQFYKKWNGGYCVLGYVKIQILLASQGKLI
jgi:hypothetical protein